MAPISRNAVVRPRGRVCLVTGPDGLAVGFWAMRCNGCVPSLLCRLRAVTLRVSLPTLLRAFVPCSMNRNLGHVNTRCVCDEIERERERDSVETNIQSFHSSLTARKSGRALAPGGLNSPLRPGRRRERERESQTARQPDSQTARQPDSQTARQPDSQTARQPDSQTARQPDRQPGSQAARQPGSQAGRQADRQTERDRQRETDRERQTDRQTERERERERATVSVFSQSKPQGLVVDDW